MGDVVFSAPRLTPSSLNWTSTTPMLSDAVADTPTELPDTYVPAAGAVIEIVGFVLSTITITAAEVVWLPAALRATAVNVCEPFAAVVVFHVVEYGADVSSAPRLAPSSLN